MFKELRRHDRELSRSETEDILVKGSYGVLSMNGADDYAYGVPLSYVYMDNCLYFHCALEGQKLSCIRHNNKVTFCVVGEANPLPNEFSMQYKSAIVFGKATEVNNDEKLAALVALVEKYANDNDYIVKGKQYALNSLHKTAVVRIDIEHMTGKARR